MAETIAIPWPCQLFEQHIEANQLAEFIGQSIEPELIANNVTTIDEKVRLRLLAVTFEYTIEEALKYFDTTLDELLTRGIWSRLLADAGVGESIDAPDEHQFAKGRCRMSHIPCPRQITHLKEYLSSSEPVATNKAPALIEMLHTTLWGTQHSKLTLDLAEQRLRANPSVINDLHAVLEYRLKHSPLIVSPALSVYDPLAIHAAYTRDEILVALGHWSFNHRPSNHRRASDTFGTASWTIHHCCSCVRSRACPLACLLLISSSAHASRLITRQPADPHHMETASPSTNSLAPEDESPGGGVMPSRQQH